MKSCAEGRGFDVLALDGCHFCGNKGAFNWFLQCGLKVVPRVAFTFMSGSNAVSP